MRIIIQAKIFLYNTDMTAILTGSIDLFAAANGYASGIMQKRKEDPLQKPLFSGRATKSERQKNAKLIYGMSIYPDNHLAFHYFPSALFALYSTIHSIPNLSLNMAK